MELSPAGQLYGIQAVTDYGEEAVIALDYGCVQPAHLPIPFETEIDFYLARAAPNGYFALVE
jgi:hypothetical protein